MSDTARDFKVMVESFNQHQTCDHDGCERTEVDGLVRYHCAECGYTMFMSLALEASLDMAP